MSDKEKIELQIPVNESLYKKIRKKLNGVEVPIKEINIKQIFEDEIDKEIIQELNTFAKNHYIIVKFIPYQKNEHTI